MQKAIIGRRRMEEEREIYVFVPFESDYKDKVLAYLSRALDKKTTINSIKEYLRLSYGSLHSTICRLQEDKIINIEEVGNYKLVSLNFENMLTIAELARISVKISQEVLGKSKKLKRLNVLVESLRKYKEILSIVLFGSQARLQASETSDIDLLVILSETSENPGKFASVEKMESLKKRALVNEIASEIRSFAIKEFLDIQHFIVDYEMFMRMLQSKDELNVGKEALKDGIILCGYENYWKIVGDVYG